MRALSAGGSRWQSRGLAGAAAIALVLGAPALAAPGGDIDTLPRGDYVCELPGDVTGPVSKPVPDEAFSIVTASSYRARGSMGSYLLTGDRLVMTSGAHRGNRYHRLSDGFLRKLDAAGNDSDMRCVRSKRNNS